MSTEEHDLIRHWKTLEAEAKACGARDAVNHCKERIKNAKLAIAAHEQARERLDAAKAVSKAARSAEKRAADAHQRGTRDPVEAARRRDELDAARSAYRVAQAEWQKATIAWSNAENALHAARLCKELQEEMDVCIHAGALPAARGETGHWFPLPRSYTDDRPPPRIQSRMWWPVCVARALALYADALTNRGGKIRIESGALSLDELRRAFEHRTAASDRYWDARRQQLASEAALLAAEVSR